MIIATVSHGVAFAGMGAGLMAMLTIIWCQSRILGGFQTKEFAFSVMIGTVSFAIGMLAGFFASPVTGKEEDRFNSIVIGLMGLFTGYLGAKVIDPVLQVLMDNDKLAENPNVAVNSAVSVCMVALGFMFAYLLRTSFGTSV